tara:strand:- start:2875 stop:4218 length:1344 start_codon:yes stop_codon:yes gene_type:complete
MISTFANLFKRRLPEQQPTWLILLGILSVTVYAFSRTGFPEIARIGSTIATLTGLWGLFKYGKIVNSHILLRFIWIAVIIQLISWGLSQYVTPEWAEDIPKLDKLTRWFVFIPLAWWVAQHQSAIWLVWGAAAMGILISPWTTGGGFNEIIQGINGSRIDFGIRNAQHTALYFGTILIALCCFIKPLYKINKHSLAPIGLLIAYCLLVIYINESRQAWLALLIALLATTTYLTIKSVKKASPKKQILSITLFILGLVTLSTLLLNNDKVISRVMVEKETITAVASLNFDEVPYSSFGIRLHSWVAATDFIKEKPLLGWGSNGRGLVMEYTTWLPDSIGDFGHLHNSYMEILVNYGIVGLLFYFSIWIVIGKMLFKQIREGNIKKEIGYLFATIFCFWGVLNCFESFMNFWTGVFYFNIFMAGILSKIWQASHPLYIKVLLKNHLQPT